MRKTHAEHHYVQRFYTPDTLRQVLEEVGFRVIRMEPVFSHPIAIRLFRGAMRLQFDWSNPVYNLYSLASAPIVKRLEESSPPSGEIVRAVFLMALAQRPGPSRDIS